MTHAESHGTHDHPHLDQSWTNQHPNGHWSALCERKRRNSTVNVFRCNNPILILQRGAEIISQRFAPEWCVVALKTTCSTSPSINGHNLHMFIEKATRLPQNDYWSTVLRRTTCTQQLFDIVVSQSPEPTLFWNGV